MRLFVEHLLDKKLPVCVIDPKGDWWGIKSSADGKSAGYPLVIFGGDHADVPLNASAGKTVAELAATENRPCVIDLGGWMPSDRTRFFIDFASTFFLKTRGRRCLVLDEVHNFCFKAKVLSPQAGEMLHWANRLASEGLGKGVNLIAASQRPQKVHNDFLTSCETLVGLRVIHASDRAAYEAWIEGCGDEDKGAEVIKTLAQLKRGEAWVWSPESQFGPKRIQFPLFDTYDSFKPQSIETPAKLKGWADVDLSEVTQKLEKVVKEAEANDPAKLKSRIRELEAAVKKGALASSAATKVVIDQKAIERELIKADKFYRKQAADMANHFSRDLLVALQNLRDLGDFKSKFKFESYKISGGEIHQQKEGTHTSESRRVTAIPRIAPNPRPDNSSSDASLPVGEKAILTALIQYPDGCDRRQLSILTGYKRSSRDAYIARLRQKGYADEQGDLLIATDQGVSVMGNVTPLPTGQELQEYWLRELPIGESKIFGILLEAGGEPVDRAVFDELCGFARSSRDAYLSRLVAKQIVETVGRGQVKAAKLLFE